MSFIEQALRRIQDPTMQKLEGKQPQTAESQPSQPSDVHPWPTKPSASTVPGASTAAQPMTPALTVALATGPVMR